MTTITKFFLIIIIDSKNDEFSDSDLAGHWGFMGKCDLPLRTTQNFADFIFSDIDPDFIIWTGDNPSHSEWKQDNQNEVYNVTKLFSDMLKRKSKRTNEVIPVYPCLGNHEKFPIDQYYPYDNIIEKPLLKTIGDIWIDFLGEEAYQEFTNYGFYSKKHLDTNLRIVSYNCLLCDVVDFYLIKNPNDPNNQLKWLENTFANAEKNGEIVYLIGHIPVGDSSFLSECSRRYQVLLDRYSHIIRGHFSGHTHFDEVKIMTRFYNEEESSGMIFIAPSLTT